LEKRYAHFSALIHFLDPSKDAEEVPIDIDIRLYEDAMVLLDKGGELTVDDLASLFESSPESIRVFELILQLTNFTNAQRTYLMFDLDSLNSPRADIALEYILHELEHDEVLRKASQKAGVLVSGRIPKLDELNHADRLSMLAQLKRVIADLCRKRDSDYLVKRLSMSRKVRNRVAKYLLENRALNDVLKGIRHRNFIRGKRLPRDTKSAHGKYSTRLLKQVLESSGFECCDGKGVCSEKVISRTGTLQGSVGPSNPFSYCTEKRVESVLHAGSPISSESASRREPTAKRFDFVLLYENEPKVVIETNFYTTSGSKIGINEKEYLALHTKIVEEEKGLRFIWVTDGSYWLTKTGRKSFAKLAPSFEDDLMNIGMFAADMDAIKARMMNSS